ncbi:unnamed protein product [Pedinophyceae sp. YPF-701]|nr:unnamed protein product [Pedinophyceae sp. YPF-701]
MSAAVQPVGPTGQPPRQPLGFGLYFVALRGLCALYGLLGIGIAGAGASLGLYLLLTTVLAPDQRVVITPVNFDYTGGNPVAVVALGSREALRRSRANLLAGPLQLPDAQPDVVGNVRADRAMAPGEKFSVVLEMELADDLQSSTDLFVVAADLLTLPPPCESSRDAAPDEQQQTCRSNLLARTVRTAVVPLRSRALRAMSAFIRLPFLLTGIAAESQHVRVELAHGAVEQKDPLAAVRLQLLPRGDSASAGLPVVRRADLVLVLELTPLRTLAYWVRPPGWATLPMWAGAVGTWSLGVAWLAVVYVAYSWGASAAPHVVDGVQQMLVHVLLAVAGSLRRVQGAALLDAEVRDGGGDAGGSATSGGQQSGQDATQQYGKAGAAAERGGPSRERDSTTQSDSQ